MKKLLLFFFTLCALQMSAQEFHFAPRVGTSIANLTNADSDSRIGLNIGVTGEMLLTPAFALESGLYYSMQGSKEGDAVFKIDYINLPVLAKVYAYQGLNFFAGPQLGINVSSSVKSNGISIDTDEIINSLDLGLNVGIGYQFNMGLQLSTSYTYGLVGVVDMDKISQELSTYDNSHNSVFQINVGWRF